VDANKHELKIKFNFLGDNEMKKFLLAFFLVFMGFAVFQSRADAATVELDVTGFVDLGYAGNDTTDDPATIEPDRNSFAVDEVELDITGKADEKVSFRMDLQYLNTDGTLTADEIIEQAYVDINLDKFTLTFGKFNAPIGFELLDKPDMYQISHAMVFNLGIPTNLTGAMVSGSYGEMFDLNLYIANGWDLMEDNNKDKTIGGRLGITPMEGVNLGLSLIVGKEADEAGGSDDQKTRTAFDIDFTFDMIEHLIIGAELNFGTYEGQSRTNPGTDAEWTGYLVTAHYEFTEMYGLTLRIDGFDDQDGARFASGKAENRTALTIAPKVEISHALEFVAEYKITTSDENVFEEAGGTHTDSQNSGALELLYKF